MNRFYIYVYLDVRKFGVYKYGDYTFDYEPFYVGKGKGRRCYDHLTEARGSSCYSGNLNKMTIIKEILQENIEPNIIKVKEGLSERESLDLEIELILLIGRLDFNNGPLTNKSDGGETGCRPSPETIEKLRIINTGENSIHWGKKRSDETKKLMSEAMKIRQANGYNVIGENNPMYGKHHSENARKKISEANTGNPGLSGKDNPMYGRTGKDCPGWGKKQSEETKLKLKEIYNNKTKEEREIINEKRKKTLEERGIDVKGKNNGMYGKHQSEETKRKISEKAKGRVVSDEGRRNMSIAQKRRKKREAKQALEDKE